MPRLYACREANYQDFEAQEKACKRHIGRACRLAYGRWWRICHECYGHLILHGEASL